MEKSTIEVEDLEEGDDFLLELAAIEAEAQAASAKRSRVSTPEGPYMAALKGSKSEQWQSSPLNPASKSRGGFQRSDGGGSVSVNSNPPGNYGADQEFPEKNCSCGLGVCSIFTSNTQKNPGRKFYRCPAKEENGGCGFFQWCDADAVQSSSGTYSSGSKFPDLQCPCGSGLCRVLTAKTGENVGRQFYRCPVFEGSCGFFKWCNDDAVNSPTMHSYTKTSNLGGSDTRAYQVAKTGTPCYKCGKEGHWARDCTVQSGTPVSQTGPVKSSAAAGDCYKCGKQGHWSRDCTAQTGNPMSETGPVKSSSDCYKCGKQGHWSRDCPAQSGNPMSETGSVKSTAATGDCYKCGKQGHWARDCTAQSGNPMAESGQVKSSSSTGECYKCGKNGHWARDCTGGSGNQEFQSGQGKTGSSGGDCYKCGKPGHWARDCTSAGQSINTQGKRPRQ